MKKMIAGVIGLSLLGVGFTAAAVQTSANSPQQNTQYMSGNSSYHESNGGRHGMMRGGHDNSGHRGEHNGRTSVYRASQSTTSPGETLKKMSADAPALNKDGKQYYVHTSIDEIQPGSSVQ